MSRKSIAIITDWGEAIGSGHIQRMTALLWFLITVKHIDAYIVTSRLPAGFPEELKPHVKKEIENSPILIIRDMRDSTREEIKKLQEICTVLVIDDIGEGRACADYAIDIMPNPESRTFQKDHAPFIYGYEFFRSLGTLIDAPPARGEASELSDRIITKEIDYALYPGFHPSDEYTESLISLLPNDSVFAILSGEQSCLHRHGQRYEIPRDAFAEILLLSKALVSHYGILVHEAHLCGCRVACINPTPYHSRLTELAKERITVENLGEYNSLNRDAARKIIAATRENPLSSRISVRKIYNEVLENLERLYKIFTPHLS
jgi:hypothetical protein